MSNRTKNHLKESEQSEATADKKNDATKDVAETEESTVAESEVSSQVLLTHENETKKTETLVTSDGEGSSVPTASSTSLDSIGKSEEEEDDDEDDDDEQGMSLGDHLRELRKRLLYAILWAIVGFIPCYAFGTDLFLLLKQPLIDILPEGSDIIFTGLPDGFFTEMKIGLVAGVFLASPMIFYQLWSFIAPGLYKEEKAFILPIAFFSGFFFIAGGAFCYFITFPVAFKFFLTYNSAHMKAMLSATEYLSFSLHLIFAFGLVFELPLVVFFLSRIGIVTPQWLRKMRRYAVLAIVIVAAILAPPDVLSQLLMCVPMFVLYELSIIVAVLFGKEKPKEEEEDDDDDDDGEEEKGDEEKSHEHNEAATNSTSPQ